MASPTCPPCENDGACEWFNGEYGCVCPSGFSGALCQQTRTLAVNVDVLIALVVIAAIVLIVLLILLVVCYIRRQNKNKEPTPTQPTTNGIEARPNETVYNVSLSRSGGESYNVSMNRATGQTFIAPQPQISTQPDGQVYNLSQNVSVMHGTGTVNSQASVMRPVDSNTEVIVPQKVQLLYPPDEQPRSHLNTLTRTTPASSLPPGEDLIIPERAQLLYPGQGQGQVDNLQGYKQANVQPASQTQTLIISAPNGGGRVDGTRMLPHLQPDDQTVYVMHTEDRPDGTNQVLYVAGNPPNPSEEVIVPKEVPLYHPSEPQTVVISSDNPYQPPYMPQPVYVQSQTTVLPDVPPAQPPLQITEIPEPQSEPSLTIKEIIEEDMPQPKESAALPTPVVSPPVAQPQPTTSFTPPENAPNPVDPVEALPEPNPAPNLDPSQAKNGSKKHVIFQTQASMESTRSDDQFRRQDSQMSTVPLGAEQMLARNSTYLHNSVMVDPTAVNQAPPPDPLQAPPSPPPPPPLPVPTAEGNGEEGGDGDEQRWKAVIQFQ